MRTGPVAMTPCYMRAVATLPQVDRQATWVVIAAMNEEDVIAGVIGELRRDGWPVVVVDDGSRDATEIGRAHV